MTRHFGEPNQKKCHQRGLPRLGPTIPQKPGGLPNHPGETNVSPNHAPENSFSPWGPLPPIGICFSLMKLRTSRGRGEKNHPSPVRGFFKTFVPAPPLSKFLSLCKNPPPLLPFKFKTPRKCKYFGELDGWGKRNN